MLTTTYALMREGKIDIALPAATGKMTRAQLAAPVPIATLLDMYGARHALRILGCDKSNKRVIVLIAADIAESV